MRFLLNLIIVLSVACQEKNDFGRFTANFREIKNASYDSILFANNFLVDSIKLEMVDNLLRPLIHDTVINKQINSQYLYEAFYLDKRVNRKVTLLTYYLRANRNLPIDAYIQTVILCTYETSTGKLVDRTQIATDEQYFGLIKKQFATWTHDQIEVNQFEIKPGGNNSLMKVNEKQVMFRINENGIIESTSR